MLKSIKRIITINICIFIIIAPLMCNYNSFSYADDEPTATNWLPCDTEEMIIRGAKAFLKVNNFYWTYSPVGQFYKWTYNYMEEQASNQGYTMTEISQGMKYRYMDNGKIQFYFTAGCLQMLNDVYEGMLRNLGITPNSFKTVYSGKYYIDNNNNHIMCFTRVNGSNKYDSWNGVRTNFYNEWTGFGQMYAHKGIQLKDVQSVTYDNLTTYNNRTGFTYNITSANKVNFGTYNGYFYGINSYGCAIYCELGFISGYDCIVYTPYNDKYYLATFLDYNMLKQDGSLNSRRFNISGIVELKKNNDNNGNASVNANQGNTPQNTFNPDTDYTINEPDNDNDEPEPEPVNPPAEQQPVPPDSVLPNPENPTINPGNPDFNFQMPDINIDWNLPFDVNNMPFPFSIPFDIKNFLEILDADPIAPSYEFDFYILDNHVEYEIDLSQFDDAMEIIRNIELAGYCIFLIISTRALFHIY